MHLSSAPQLRAHHEHKKQLMVSRHCHTATAFDTTLRPLIWNMNSQKIDQNKAICLAHKYRRLSKHCLLNNQEINPLSCFHPYSHLDSHLYFYPDLHLYSTLYPHLNQHLYLHLDSRQDQHQTQTKTCTENHTQTYTCTFTRTNTKTSIRNPF